MNIEYENTSYHTKDPYEISASERVGTQPLDLLVSPHRICWPAVIARDEVQGRQTPTQNLFFTQVLR
jgi:hypothetical protein